MLKSLVMTSSMLFLMGSLPAFASAAVSSAVMPNEVIPMKKLSDGTRCPQLAFGHKIIEKVLSDQKARDNFAVSINSVVWYVDSENLGETIDNVGLKRNKNKKGVSLFSPQHAGVCRYSVELDGKYVGLTMRLKSSYEDPKTIYMQKVTEIVQQAKAAGVSRADLLAIVKKATS